MPVSARLQPGKSRIKVVTGKIGLDDHFRGIICVTEALREAGMEVVYLGAGQTVDGLLSAVLQEDADVIGLSFLCGGHLQVVKRLKTRMRARGMGKKLLLVGGIVPEQDVPLLKAMGVAEVFLPGTPMAAIVRYVTEHVRKK
ncbi:MAG: cobalamin B12-binding domain-containing protein [Chloroflexi bacterium]|nr:cobalamin B12-binding domain-containing protein [Chloroflexota bacterium]